MIKNVRFYATLAAAFCVVSANIVMAANTYPNGVAPNFDMNGVMLQGFHWYSEPNDSKQDGKKLWKFIESQSDHYRAIGINAIWIPPAYKGNTEWSAGYDVYDRYDLGEFNQKTWNGETKYGSKKDLVEMVNTLHGYSYDGRTPLNKKYINVYGDIVINHMMNLDLDDTRWEAIRVYKNDRNKERWTSPDGFECDPINVQAWTKFVPKSLVSNSDPKVNRRDYSTFEWHTKHFDGVDAVDTIEQYGKTFSEPGGDSGKYIYRFLRNENGDSKSWDNWVALENGNYDYLMGCDIDYGRQDVRDEVKNWGTWFTKTVNLDGWRFDASKHISAWYQREWLGHVRATTGKPNGFAVAEYWTQNHDSSDEIHSFLTEVTTKGQYPQDISAFDVALHYKFNAAASANGLYDLRQLAKNTLQVEQPAKAVTFVENHDTQEDNRSLASKVEEWFKPLAYAYILLQDKGYPCVFWPDYYGSNDAFDEWKDADGNTVKKQKHWGKMAGGNQDRTGYLDVLLKLRKQFALGEQRYYDKHPTANDVIGWVRMGGVPGAKGAMAVVMNDTNKVMSVRMDTDRGNKKFYHYATLKWADNNFVVAKYKYNMYGSKSESTTTNSGGEADFLADGKSVSIWLEDGVGVWE